MVDKTEKIKGGKTQKKKKKSEKPLLNIILQNRRNAKLDNNSAPACYMCSCFHIQKTKHTNDKVSSGDVCGLYMYL